MNNTYDIICIGAGPTGLASAIEAKRVGMRPLVLDQGCLCNSIFHYPASLTFFTTSERMEIGDLPLTVASNKATRTEALKYYRKAAEHYGLELRLYERVDRIAGHEGKFEIATVSPNGIRQRYSGARVVIATGYYDRPNLLGIPGEDLPHVSHYFSEPHAFWGRDVVVIGAKNSAAEAALDLFRAGARVTLVHRGETFGSSLKYWVRPDLENRIRAGEIRAFSQTRVTHIATDHVVAQNGGRHELPASQVFAMTGYHPDFEFLERAGIELGPVTRKPRCNLDTLESNVPGVYLAGVLLGGLDTGEIFIENGRFHGKQIIAGITGRLTELEPAPVRPRGE